MPVFCVWNLFGIKINIRHKWPGILGLWGLGIIIRLSLFDCGGGIISIQAGPPHRTTKALMIFHCWSLPLCVIPSRPQGLWPLTLLVSDKIPANIIYQTEHWFNNCPVYDSLAVMTKALPWIYIQLHWCPKAWGHLCHCSVLADPTEKNSKICWLIT